MLADAVKILFALGLPFLTGALFVMALGPTNRPGYVALVTGLALPLGFVGVIGGYLVLGKWGGELRLGSNLTIQLVLLSAFALLAWRSWRTPAQVSTGLPTTGGFEDLPRASGWLIGLILAWLMLRWLGIIVEVVHRPLFPWDAWYAYGLQAKIWFFQPRLDAVTGTLGWFLLDDKAWSAGGTRHPPGIAFIQLWSLQWLGRYDETLMNLAWPMALASLGLSLFGTLRTMGADLLAAIGVAAVTVSLPMLNIQAVLAGYGDIWVALFFLLAVSGGVLARAFGLRWMTVTVVAVAGMLLIKETSWLWLPVLSVGLLAGWMRLRWLLLSMVLGFLGLLGILWLYGEPVRVSTVGRLGFSAGGFVFPQKVNFEAWSEIVMWPDLLRHMFVYRNWHLFWYLAPIAGLAALLHARSQRVFMMLAVVTWGGMTLLIGIFSFSTLGNAVIDGTSVNRLLLHLVPAIALMGGLVVMRWQGRLEPESR